MLVYAIAEFACEISAYIKKYLSALHANTTIRNGIVMRNLIPERKQKIIDIIERSQPRGVNQREAPSRKCEREATEKQSRENPKRARASKMLIRTPRRVRASGSG